MYQDVLDFAALKRDVLTSTTRSWHYSAREQGIGDIISFDRDFDELPWLIRVGDPSQFQG